MKKVWNLFMIMLLISALVLPVCAEAVNSVRQPGAPVVSEVEDKAANIVITPLVEQNKAPWAVQQELKAATKALNDGDLTKVSGVEDAVKAMNAAAQKTETKVEDLVVSEVFHVDADKTGIAVTFQAEGIRAGQFLMVMVFVDGQWKTLDFDAVEILEDGKVRITFQQYGTVAFIVDRNEQAKYLAEQAK